MENMQDLVGRRYDEWSKKVTDPAVLAELADMRGDEKKKTDCFYKELEFGTGGLRGTLGAGTNCLNIYTIKKVTQGICGYMKDHGLKKAALCCDSRINSELFKRTAAAVFAAAGFFVVMTGELMPVPFLSYLTRETGSDIGVMITASHNPKQYNGYKVYGADGCQLTDAAAAEMTGYIAAVDPFEVKADDAAAYLAAGKIEYAPDALAEAFLTKVQAENLDGGAGLSVVYSPLNGAGYRMVPEILRRVGVEKIDIVPEQAYPDGNFTTCPYPNPEKPAALELGLRLAQKTGADILIATDPDCDRMGCAVLDKGQYTLLSGNEVGVLLTDYLLSRRRALGILPDRPVLVKTIVTTDLALKIAGEYGAEVIDVLTGFKYIGDVIGKLEQRGEASRFVLGFEESYGYSSGTYVRDKDGVDAAMLTAAMAAYYKRQGLTLKDRIDQIYETYGHYEHRLLSFEFPGAAGSQKMRELLKRLREAAPAAVGGLAVTDVTDYLTQTKFELPKADVLSYTLAGGCKLIVRPSGTEPLIKTYLTVNKTPSENAAIFKRIQAELDRLFA
ncbi:MAG: phospho-sugar mutase [Clostridiales bacterium]|jgi:phosphoglucomutase|nr:phospho-sugar mutase [Clostridiales bacterium]